MPTQHTPEPSEIYSCPTCGNEYSGSDNPEICKNIMAATRRPKKRHANACATAATLKAVREALEHMANMPEYDQDDAHRLRHLAKQTAALLPATTEANSTEAAS